MNNDNFYVVTAVDWAVFPDIEFLSSASCGWYSVNQFLTIYRPLFIRVPILVFEFLCQPTRYTLIQTIAYENSY